MEDAHDLATLFPDLEEMLNEANSACSSGGEEVSAPSKAAERTLSFIQLWLKQREIFFSITHDAPYVPLGLDATVMEGVAGETKEELALKLLRNHEILQQENNYIDGVISVLNISERGHLLTWVCSQLAFYVAELREKRDPGNDAFGGEKAVLEVDSVYERKV